MSGSVLRVQRVRAGRLRTIQKCARCLVAGILLSVDANRILDAMHRRLAATLGLCVAYTAPGVDQWPLQQIWRLVGLCSDYGCNALLGGFVSETTLEALGKHLRSVEGATPCSEGWFLRLSSVSVAPAAQRAKRCNAQLGGLVSETADPELVLSAAERYLQSPARRAGFHDLCAVERP